MPVEIKELVIRAVVDQEARQAGGHGPGHAGRHRAAAHRTSTKSSGVGPDEREAIVAAAVKEVLRILRTSKER